MEEKNYEGVIILRTETNIEQFKKELFQEKILSIQCADLGEKHLAYEIKGCTKGHYLSLLFKSNPLQCDELEQHLKTNNFVLKYMTMEI